MKAFAIRGLLPALAGLIALTGSAASAEQWKVTVGRVGVAPTKDTGQPWDGEGSAPDVVGVVQVGTIQEGKCVPQRQERITKHQDTFNFDAGVSLVVDRMPGAELCIQADLADKDVLDDDPIGRGAARLQEGEQVLEMGQGRIAIHFAPVAAQRQEPVVFAPPPVPRSNLYRISIVSAQVAPKRGDGATWDEPKDVEAENAKAAKALLRIGLGLATGGTSTVIGAVAGRNAGRDDPTATHTAKTVAAPDPQVRFRFGDAVFQTPVQRNTAIPAYNTQFLVPEALLARPTRVEVVDADDGAEEPIGTDLVSQAKLTGEDVVRLKFGGVEELLLQVERVQERAKPTEREYNLATANGWLDTGLDVVGGQTVQVSATGEHCMPGGVCVGPEGRAGSVAFEAANGERAVQEGELCVFFGDRILPIGPGRSFIAHMSGRLFLGAATQQVSTGALTAQVKVFYPVEERAQAAVDVP